MAQQVRMIDLSLPLENFSFEPRAPEIKYYDHKEWARALAKNFGVDPADFPSIEMTCMDYVSASTHSGTHVDAPLHYGPLSEGRPARSIDQVPLEWCYGPGVVLDMRHKQTGEYITVGDLEEAVAKIDYQIQSGDIVLLMTGCDRYYRTSRYSNAHPGLGREGTLWLTEQGVRVIGIDAYGLDRPFPNMIEDAKKGDRSAWFPAHLAGRDREYLQIEKMANLDTIPRPYGFTVACFPVNIAKASGGWARPVAIITE